MPRTSDAAFNSGVRSLDSQRNLLVVTCLILALLVLGLLTPPAHAAVAGRYLYVVDKAVGQVEGFSIDRIKGTLLSLGACALRPVGVSPDSEAVDPTGSFLYVSDFVGNQIFGFAITPATGCLAPIGVWPTIGTGPMSAHVTTDGRYLYVSETLNATAAVEGFQVGAGGILAPVPLPNPFVYGVNPGGLAFDSVGPYLFAADDSAPVGPITPLEYKVGGTLFKAPGCPGPCPTVTPNPVEMSVSPAGQDMLVLSGGGITLDSYAINRLTGALTWVNTLPLAAGPHSVYADPFGRFGYVSNNVASTVQPYTITTGVVAVNGAAVALPAGSAPAGLKVDEWGKFLYIALPGTSQVAGYTINATTGRLVKILGSPWNTFVPAAGPVSVHGITP